MDDDTIRRWVALDAHGMNDHLVANPVPLWRLLQAMSDDPSTVPEDLARPKTNQGGQHVFDVDAVQRFAAPLSRLTRSGLGIPIRLRVRHQDPNDVTVEDPTAIEAMVEGGHAATAPRDGRLWLGRLLAVRLSQEFPSVFQFVYQ